MTYLGLDLGTSGLRALLADEHGAVLHVADAAYSGSHPISGWSEQNPADWVSACEVAIEQLRQVNPTAVSAIRAIGLSGHMHGATLLDESGSVLRPCIMWNDTRAAVEAQVLDQTLGFREQTGNIVFAGFTAPKLMWVRNNEPEIFDAVSKVLLPKDYLRYWLSGEYISDMSDSAGTSWLDTSARDWSQELLSASGMRREQMPNLCEGSEIAGYLRPELARSWGIEHSVVIAGGGGDNAVAACGAGCLADGHGFVSLGTSGVLLAAQNRYRPDPKSALHTFCHAVPDTWYQMGVILAATDSLNWLSRLTTQSPATLAQRMPEHVEGPSKIKFLPYLSGERTPHNDSAVRATMTGLDINHDVQDMTQAVMEGVAFALRDSLEAMKATGTELSKALAIGGGTRSPFWVETLATVLDIPLDMPDKGEFGAALGAARLAMCASGHNMDDVMTAPEISHRIDPRRDLSDAYDTAYQEYRAIYPALN